MWPLEKAASKDNSCSRNHRPPTTAAVLFPVLTFGFHSSFFHMEIKLHSECLSTPTHKDDASEHFSELSRWTCSAIVCRAVSVVERLNPPSSPTASSTHHQRCCCCSCCGWWWIWRRKLLPAWKEDDDDDDQWK